MGSTLNKAREFKNSWRIYREDHNCPYWKSPEEVVEIQNRNLAQQVDLVARYHPYYRRLFSEHGLEAGDIRNLEDLERVPLTRKRDYLENPMDFRLSPKQKSSRDTLYEVTYTTGVTTGEPAPFFNTTHDMFAGALQMRRMCEIAWMTPEDIILNLFPFGIAPHIGFYRTMWFSAAAGMRTVFAFTGSGFPEFPVHNSMHRAIDLAETCMASVVSGIGSYERRFLREARRQGRGLSNIRIVMALGEAVPRRMRDDMREMLAGMGARDAFINNAFGFTEMQGAMPECVEYGGCHNPAPELYFLEVVDGDTGRRKPEGENGMLAVTHLNRRGTVLLRYLLGDIGIVDYGVCPNCGRSGGKLAIKESGTYTAHSSELLEINGICIDPVSLNDELCDIKGVEEYQVVITGGDPSDSRSHDQLIVRMAPASGFNIGSLKQEIARRVKRAVDISPRVEAVPIGEIYDINASLKVQRLVDTRPVREISGNPDYVIR